MATIKDVAACAGVSKTLVSRYISGQRGVSAESGALIEAAIEKLNYRPNRLARSLVQRRTYCIGVSADDLSSVFIVPLIAGLEYGVSHADAAHEYTVIYTTSCGDYEKKKRQLNFLTQGHVDGLIVYGSAIPGDDLMRQLASSRFPLVLIENGLADLHVSKVLIDNAAGAFAATEHLIQLGHTRIAHFGGDFNLRITLDRMDGFTRAMQKYGIRIEPDWMVFPAVPKQDGGLQSGLSRSDFYEQAYASMRRLLGMGRVPDAIFFATDLAAFGAVRALKEAGLRVPEDVSIIGFDDENTAAALYEAQPITTMRQPLHEAGDTAVRLMIERLENPSLPPVTKHLATRLIDRQTTRAPKSVLPDVNV